MLAFRPSLPLVLSSLYIFFSQVQAQTPPACAIQCGNTAAAASGCNLYDTTCICTNPVFQQSASTCVTSTCSYADAQAALAYFGSLCPGVPSSVSSPTLPYSSSSSSASSSSSVTVVYPSSSSMSSSSSRSVSYGVPTSGSVTYRSSSSLQTTPPSYTQPSSTTSSPPTSSSRTTSNAAATPSHAAALVAGGIGALFAIVV